MFCSIFSIYVNELFLIKCQYCCIDLKKKSICKISIFLLYRAILKQLLPLEKKIREDSIETKIKACPTQTKNRQTFPCEKRFVLTVQRFVQITQHCRKACSILCILFWVSCKLFSERVDRVLQQYVSGSLREQNRSSISH